MKKWSFAQLKKQTKFWRGAILPGLLIILLIAIVRLAGFLQVQEWMAFDTFERLRPTQVEDRRITIIGIDDRDLNTVGGFPIPDRDLATVLSILQEFQPRAIGLDLFRDTIDDRDPDRAQLGEVLQKYSNIIGIEVALNQEDSFNVKPPPELPPHRIGFADLLVDNDGKLRRCLLASRTWSGDLKYSFALRLAQTYLDVEGIEFRHGDGELPTDTPKSSEPIWFGNTRLVRFRSNSGGYVGADANGHQILLNFRAAPRPFAVLSFVDLLDRNFDPDLIRNRVVLLGMTAASVKDTFITSAVKNTIYSTQLGTVESLSNQLIYGVEIHAHATSQIISAVRDGRSQIHVWGDFWEYLWICLWGLLGISLGIALQSPLKTIFCLFLCSGGLAIASYLLCVGGWWIPIVPTILSLWGAGLTTAMVDRDLRLELEQRRETIERTFDAVHNGPLQDIAVILRSIDDEDFPREKLRSRLHSLNQELRGIYREMRQDVVSDRDSLYLQGIPVLDLQTPISELLYTVYDRTLDRDFPGFRTILTYIPPNFVPLDACHFSPDQKRDLCQFLQEALCNAGKHGLGATRLDTICRQDENWYYLQVIDNGKSVSTTLSVRKGGQGTEQAQTLARNLRGRFDRRPHTPQGTICELRWPVSKRITWLQSIRFWECDRV